MLHNRTSPSNVVGCLTSLPNTQVRATHMPFVLQITALKQAANGIGESSAIVPIQRTMVNALTSSTTSRQYLRILLWQNAK